MSEIKISTFKAFDNFLRYSHDDFSGVMATYRFPNGYGATITRARTFKGEIANDWEVKLLDKNCPFFSIPTEKNEQQWLKKFFSFEYDKNDTFVKWSLCEGEVEVLLKEIMQMKETLRDKAMKICNNLREMLVIKK